MPVTFHNSNKFDYNPSKRYLGVEVEIAYVKDDTIIRNAVEGKWHGILGWDGSVSGRKAHKERHPTSLEVKTAPANGDEFVKQMVELGKSFKKAKALTNDSCGLHVHIDARDLTDADLEKVLMLWSKVESSMFLIVSPRRSGSQWCKPWTLKSKTGPALMNEFIREKLRADGYFTDSKVLSGIKSGKYYPDRYHSLNLCALSSHGTLENRMHHGTTNIQNIIHWAMLNSAIVDYAKNNTMEDIAKLENSFDTLVMVASTDKLKEWVKGRKEFWIHRIEELKVMKEKRKAERVAAKEAKRLEKEAAKEAAKVRREEELARIALAK